MDEIQYRQADGLNFSLAKHLLKSPRHFKAALASEQEETMDMRLGTAIHQYFLMGVEPQYVLRPDELDGKPWHGNRSVCRAWKKEREDAGIVVFDSALEARQMRMIQSLKDHAGFQMMLEYAGENKEVPLFAEYRGVKIKGKLDLWFKDDEGMYVIPDVKKCPDASPYGWGSACANRAYRMQMQWYSMLLGLTQGVESPIYGCWTVIEDSEACPVQIYRHTEASALIGQRQMDLCIDRYLQMQESGEAPGYSDEILDVMTLNYESKY